MWAPEGLNPEALLLNNNTLMYLATYSRLTEVCTIVGPAGLEPRSMSPQYQRLDLFVARYRRRGG